MRKLFFGLDILISLWVLERDNAAGRDAKKADRRPPRIRGQIAILLAFVALTASISDQNAVLSKSNAPLTGGCRDFG
jgi:hypothetical protein